MTNSTSTTSSASTKLTSKMEKFNSKFKDNELLNFVLNSLKSGFSKPTISTYDIAGVPSGNLDTAGLMNLSSSQKTRVYNFYKDKWKKLMKLQTEKSEDDDDIYDLDQDASIISAEEQQFIGMMNVLYYSILTERKAVADAKAAAIAAAHDAEMDEMFAEDDEILKREARKSLTTLADREIFKGWTAEQQDVFYHATDEERKKMIEDAKSETNN